MTDEQLEALAQQSEGKFTRRRRKMEDFRYDEQQAKYWDTTTGNLLISASVDGAIHRDDWPTLPDKRSGKDRPIPPSKVINGIDTGLTVEGSTWWPGLPRFIENFVVSERGAMPMGGAMCYNSYIPPNHGDLSTDQSPEPWIDHVKKLYPDPVEQAHFFQFAAHMIQRPDEKVNHGLVMAGAQGIGKDTALLPLRWGVGEWNAAEVGPEAVTGAYNGFVKSVLLVINEVRPHDEDFKASNFYNMLKPILASPPEMLPMTVKYANTIYVRNLSHVILTTNDPLTMYIPPEDRRLFVMSSPLEDPKVNPVFPPDYFDRFHSYLQAGGTKAVVKWLLSVGLLEGNATAPPPMTRGKTAIIESAHQVRRTLVDDVFEKFVEQNENSKKPKVFFHRDLLDFVRESDFFDDAQKVVNLLNAKNFHFKMSERGYDMLRNPDAMEWREGKFRSRIAFCRRDVPVDEQLDLVKAAIKSRGVKI